MGATKQTAVVAVVVAAVTAVIFGVGVFVCWFVGGVAVFAVLVISSSDRN